MVFSNRGVSHFDSSTTIMSFKTDNLSVLTRCQVIGGMITQLARVR